jgi:hypothetical protein
VSEGSTPIGGDDDAVFHSDPAVRREVNTRFDGDDVADAERISACPGDSRRLVDVETNPVSGSMRERFGPTRLGNDRSSSGVDLARGNTRADDPDPSLISGGDDFEHSLACVVDLADCDGTSHIGAISVDDAAEIEDHEIAILKSPIGRARMGHGSVGARGDDGLEACA